MVCINRSDKLAAEGPPMRSNQAMNHALLIVSLLGVIACGETRNLPVPDSGSSATTQDGGATQDTAATQDDFELSKGSGPCPGVSSREYCPGHCAYAGMSGQQPCVKPCSQDADCGTAYTYTSPDPNASIEYICSKRKYGYESWGPHYCTVKCQKDEDCNVAISSPFDTYCDKDHGECTLK